MNLPQLNLPEANLALATDEQGRTTVYDALRKKWLVLTPEEWVRQHFVSYLINHKGYPAAMMANEVAITFNTMKRRCDTVVYNRTAVTPLVIVEYKAPTVNITPKTFDQIARYNMVLQVKCLIVSNGLHHYCCMPDYAAGTYAFLNDIPDYPSLLV